MIIKFISNITATLYIDQEEIALLYAGKIFKYQLEIGSYLLEVIPEDKNIAAYVEDYELIEEKQTLKRIEFDVTPDKLVAYDNEELTAADENSCGQTLCFSERGIAVEKRYGVERFVTRDGKIWIVNNMHDISAQNESSSTLDTRRYDWCGRLEYSSEKKKKMFLPVLKNAKWGICDMRQCRPKDEVVSCVYDKVSAIYADWELAVCRKGSNVVMVNLNNDKYGNGHELAGQHVVAPAGEELYKTVCDEMYPVVRIDVDSWFSIDSCRTIESKSYLPHSAVVCRNGKYGILTSRNATPKYVYDDLFSKDIDGKLTRSFNTSLPLIACRGSLLGLVDANGIELTPFIYDDVFFVGELVAAQKGNAYLLLDKNGMELLPILFEDIQYDSESYIVKSNGKVGVYSVEKNDLLLPCIYDSIGQIEYKISHMWGPETIYAYLCMKNGKKGVVTKDGQLVLECRYEEIRPMILHSMGSFAAVVGYILKENGRYGLSTCNESKHMYDDIYFVHDEDCNGYAIVQKGKKWGCITYNGEVVFDIEYDSITTLDWWTCNDESYLTFLCSKDCKTYVRDEKGKFSKCLDYEEVTPYVQPLEGETRFSFVRKNGLLGLISGVVYPYILVDCKYDTLDVVTLGNKYVYLCGSRNGKKSVIVCAINNVEPARIFEVDCDEIRPVMDSVQKSSRYNKDCDAFVFVKDGKHGVMGLDGAIIVPALYDEIVQVEKDNDGKIAYFVTRHNDKLAVFNTTRRCIIPAAYDKIMFNNNYFVVRNGDAYGLYSLEGQLMLPCVHRDYAGLTTWQEQEFSRMKKIPDNEDPYASIPITIWSAEYNTYVAFNSESGSVIISVPMHFEKMMAVLKNYKDKYLERMR